MAVVRRRITQQLNEMQSNPPVGCNAWQVGDDIFHCEASIIGPEDTPYEGGKYFLDVIFPSDYPFKPPKISFKTKIYHVDVISCGTISLDIFQKQWSPAYSLSKLFQIIISMLMWPDAEQYPMCNDELAQLYNNNREVYDKTAREWCIKYAFPEWSRRKSFIMFLVGQQYLAHSGNLLDPNNPQRDEAAGCDIVFDVEDMSRMICKFL